MKRKAFVRTETVIHGGDLHTASRTFGIPIADWLDLSTGINPCAYPIPPLDEQLFTQLPYPDPGFLQAAADYYGAAEFIACHGSQALIDLLPQLLPEKPIMLPTLGYQEHQQRWQQQGEVGFYPSLDKPSAVREIDAYVQKSSSGHLLLINPNNPTGLQFSPEQVYRWAETMPPDCYLIIDEAFIDLDPTASVLSDYDRFQRLDNLIVLRSFGKFFGLAGVRLSFVFANNLLLASIKQRLGPWAVNGPAQAIAQQAFRDNVWQQQAREQIAKASREIDRLIEPLLSGLQMQCLSKGLLHSYLLPQALAESLYVHLASAGILSRCIKVDSNSAIFRIGLLDINDKSQIARLETQVHKFLNPADRKDW